MFARLILAVVSTIAVLTIVAVLLLSTGLWSPIGELVVVAVITAGCLAAQRPAVQARLAAWARPGWQALLRHIPGDRTGATRGGAHLSRGRDRERPGRAARRGRGRAARQRPARCARRGRAAGARRGRAAGTRQRPADVDAGEAPGTGAAELAGAESTAGAGTAGPTEVTTPLPAIRD